MWNINEISYLIKNYSNKTNSELSIEMNKSESSISSQAYNLNLKKSKEHKSKMIGKRNKMIGRDLSLEKLKKIAKKYKTRGQFQTFDPSAYSTARRTEHMEEICKHMIKSTSIPQITLTFIIEKIFNCNINKNDRTEIKPYELDIYIPTYNIAFEYDGKLWHNNNDNDIIKNDLCLDKNILLIRIIENNRNYIKDIKNQLINKLDKINDFCNLNIKKKDIKIITDDEIIEYSNSQLLDLDDIKRIISKYTTYKEFKQNEFKLYQKLNKMKALNLLDKLERERIYWTEEKIKEETSKYLYLDEFIKNSQKCYLFIKRHNLEHLIKKLKRKHIYLNDDIIINESKNYELLKNFKKDKPTYYAYIKRHKKWDLITHLKRLK